MASSKKSTKTKPAAAKHSPEPDLMTIGVMLEASLAMCNEGIGISPECTHYFTAIRAMLEKADAALAEGETA